MVQAETLRLPVGAERQSLQPAALKVALLLPPVAAGESLRLLKAPVSAQLLPLPVPVAVEAGAGEALPPLSLLRVLHPLALMPAAAAAAPEVSPQLPEVS